MFINATDKGAAMFKILQMVAKTWNSLIRTGFDVGTELAELWQVGYLVPVEAITNKEPHTSRALANMYLTISTQYRIKLQITLHTNKPLRTLCHIRVLADLEYSVFISQLWLPPTAQAMCLTVNKMTHCKPFPKFKGSADDNFNVDQMVPFSFDRIKNIVGKL